MSNITLMDIKQALKDIRFRDSLPVSLKPDIEKYLTNPGCPCNMPFYKKILQECKQNLQEYYPGRDIIDIEIPNKKNIQNNYSVINCHIDELQDILRKLPPGRRQTVITRYQDQLTVVINELDIVY